MTPSPPLLRATASLVSVGCQTRCSAAFAFGMNPMSKPQRRAARCKKSEYESWIACIGFSMFESKKGLDTIVLTL